MNWVIQEKIVKKLFLDFQNSLCNDREQQVFQKLKDI
jgi:hypothetical protein